MSMLLGRLQLTRNTLGISYSPMLNLQRSFAGAPQRKRGQEDDPLPSPSEVYSPGAGTRVSGGSASPLGSQNGQNILSKRLLLLRRVARVNSGGKIRSTSALVVVGNGQGSAGYGLGSSTDVQTAIQKATIQAQKTMAHIPRFDNRTIYSDVDYKVLGTRLMIKTAVPGHGVMANPHIHEICRLMGISDIYVKIYGSKNPMNVTKTFFQALQAQKTPKDIARIRGQKVIDVEMSYYGYDASSTTRK